MSATLVSVGVNEQMLAQNKSGNAVRATKRCQPEGRSNSHHRG